MLVGGGIVFGANRSKVAIRQDGWRSWTPFQPRGASFSHDLSALYVGLNVVAKAS
jgi:hypothetical protein